MTALTATRAVLRPVLSLPMQRSLRALPAEPMVASEALLKGQREVLIQHGESVYRLRHTSNGKLILTK
ncbi:hemin transporter HemP [Stenotrophomonas ginsengisoli]|uniref:Hemin transporter HemP n=1 Tax=Stenotrophomonas ginsengisoli TaxID=336566 RepID=A0A0R0DCD0_9GAMM|nr:hemin uptake protein HemP [Stenotrophomonas ginsengisoli]KRG75946.1 hemin transporter HemP [Stenotrophomonas ginsengisoli]